MGKLKKKRIRLADIFGPELPSAWDEDALEAYEWSWVLRAREDFYAFRLYLDPKIIDSWWQREVARELQQFYYDWKAGLRPKLILNAPRQHGKSIQIIDFLAWVAGHDPDARQIFTSYSDRLGIRANLRLQRIFESEKFQKVFPETVINNSNVVTMAGRPLRNSSIIEFVGKQGYFRNTTTGGRVTGESVDLGVVDDPIKGREEANSELMREKTWDWFTDDFLGCFQQDAALLAIATRYHVDDPLGRMQAMLPGVKHLRYPAIAEGPRTANDKLHRAEGEPLFPQLRSLEFLLERKKVLTQGAWESIWQQNPIIVGGGLFPVHKFGLEKNPPGRKQVRRSVRYWDKAGTAGGGAYTAGVLMHELNDGTFFISDVRRGQWGALEREQHMRQAAEMDRNTWGVVHIWVEQEPGSGGKESAERSIMNLRGFICKADRVTGDKETRAEPYAAQVQAGNVKLLVADWNRAFLNEHEQFPTGKYKDQVDAAGGAFAKCVTTNARYDVTLSNVMG